MIDASLQLPIALALVALAVGVLLRRPVGLILACRHRPAAPRVATLPAAPGHSNCHTCPASAGCSSARKHAP